MFTQAKTTTTEKTKPSKPTANRAQRRQAAKKAASAWAKTGERGVPKKKEEAVEGEMEGEAAPGVPPDEAALAFARVQPELDAVPVAERGRIMIPIPVSVSIALGALPNLEAKRDEMKQAWPAYDVQRAARLREYAYAALYAHFRAQRPAEGASRLRALLDEAGPLRERLLMTAEVHAHYGDVDAGRVAAIRSGFGHQDTANDLVELAVLFRAARAQLAGHTRVTNAEVARALALGTQIMDALGRRRVGTEEAAAPSQTEDDRIKAFWLFYDTYEESRRAMAHLRWYEGDADRLVPSLFSGRRRRGPVAEEPVEGETPVEPAEPAVPVEPVDPSEGD